MQDACHAPLSSDLVQQLGKLEEFRKVTVSRAFQMLLLDKKTIQPNHPITFGDEPVTVKMRSNLPLPIQVQKAFQFFGV